MSDYGPEIEKVLQMMPYVRQLFGEELSLAVCTTEKFIFTEDGNI